MISKNFGGMKNKSARTYHALSGFTLIEIVMVLVIIGLLASIIVPRFSKTRSLASETRIKETLLALSKASEIYYME